MGHINDILQPDQTMLYSSNVHRISGRAIRTEVTHLQALHETLGGIGDSAIAAAAGVPHSHPHRVATGAAQQ